MTLGFLHFDTRSNIEITRQDEIMNELFGCVLALLLVDGTDKRIHTISQDSSVAQFSAIVLWCLPIHSVLHTDFSGNLGETLVANVSSQGGVESARVKLWKSAMDVFCSKESSNSFPNVFQSSVVVVALYRLVGQGLL